MSLDWAFLALILACAVFLAQIVMDYSKRLADIKPRIAKTKEDRVACEREVSGIEEEIRLCKGNLSGLEQEIKSLEGKKNQMSDILQQKRQKEKRPRFKL